jgi:hypothetical protein
MCAGVEDDPEKDAVRASEGQDARPVHMPIGLARREN